MNTTTDKTRIGTDPNVVAVRLGWDDLDSLTEAVAEVLNDDEAHLVGYVPAIITGTTFAWELSHSASLTKGGAAPLDRLAIPDMIAVHCRRAHQMAASRATSQAYNDDQHRCAVTGVVDDSTHRRWIKCIRRHVQCSDTGAAAVVAEWEARNVTPDVRAQAADYLDRIGFTTSTEQPAPSRRKRTS